MKTILITGGAGFIGSNLVRFLLRAHSDYRLLILDALTYAGSLDNVPRDERVEFFHGDVRNAALVEYVTSQAEMVVHLAAETHVTRSIFDNLRFFETDVLGTQCVANEIANHENVERFVHVSTSEVYGTALSDEITEDHPLMPMSPYAAAKVGADRLVYSYWKTYGTPAIILRPFNNYGPYQHLEKVIPRFITSCILNEPLTVHGDGKASRDWVFVEDFCRAVDAVLQADLRKVVGQTINVGTGRSIDIFTIANMVREQMRKPNLPIAYTEDRPGQVSRHTSSRGKAKALLSWEPRVKFEDGLAETIKWYEENRSWWERQLWLRKVPIRTKDGKTTYH